MKLRCLETHRYTGRRTETSGRQGEPQEHCPASSRKWRCGSMQDASTLPRSRSSQLPTARERELRETGGSTMGDSHLRGHLCWGEGRDEVSQGCSWLGRSWVRTGSRRWRTGSAQQAQSSRPAGGPAQGTAANPLPVTLSPRRPQAGPSAESAPKGRPSPQDPVSHIGAPGSEP